MKTVAELLDEMLIYEQRYAKAMVEGDTDSGIAFTHTNFWRNEWKQILHGTELCLACGGSGFSYREYDAVPCLTCNNTGRIKIPGLVERLKQQVLAAATNGGGSATLPNTSAALVYGAGLAFEALEREIGEI
jgi:hypothetical protein